MASYFISKKQAELFQELAQAGELIFACGPEGISANIVGNFHVDRMTDKKEDRLNMGDGTNHVHIDWHRVKRFEVGEFHGEGMLTFFDGEEKLFRFYRPEGPFSEAILQKAGGLL